MSVIGNAITLGGGGSVALQSIAVSTPPSRTAYAVGASFDTTGMVVMANYVVNGSAMNNVVVNNADLSISPGTLTANTTSVTISYTVDGVTKTATQAVRVYAVGSSLNATSWDVISAVAQAGDGAAFWDVGDAKEITLNGTVGQLSLSSLSICVFILDFNHPENGTADNNILFGGFKSAVTGGEELTLVDSLYGVWKTDGTHAFNMSHWGNKNDGGWKGCDFRYDILGSAKTPPTGYGSSPASGRIGYDATNAAIQSPKANTLMAALPSAFRSVLRLRTHYADNVGYGGGGSADVTSVVDAISLLTEFEVFGRRVYANNYEQNHQKQMAYYADGNTTVKYSHIDQTSPAVWWLSSPYSSATYGFTVGNAAGNDSYADAVRPYGIAPVFKV